MTADTRSRLFAVRRKRIQRRKRAIRLLTVLGFACMWLAPIDAGAATTTPPTQPKLQHHDGVSGAVGKLGGTNLPQNVSSRAKTACGTSTCGYDLIASDGGIFSFGDAHFFGSTGGIHLNRPIVGSSVTPSGKGYWLVASDGGIFAFGDARFFGSTGGIHLNQPIVGMASTPLGRGYWFVASDGGIFAFGDARFFGSTGAMHLNQPIVAMAAAPSGLGYWFVASDGGIFAFGNAHFFGSAGGSHLNRPIVGMAASALGQGYWLVASDGGIFAYGGAGFFGSTGAIALNQPIITIAVPVAQMLSANATGAVVPAAPPGRAGPLEGFQANNASDMESFMTYVINSVANYWEANYQAWGVGHTHIFYDWFYGTASSLCGAIDIAAYCPDDDTIYINVDFEYHEWLTFGNFAPATVIAHEFGHNVQEEFQLGYTAPYSELQADCFAGNWANSQYYAGTLEAGDIEAALGSLAEAAGGDHGTAQQRDDAFWLGYYTGNPGDCS
ncbi:MAG: neutral zinc metallopeptidase [Actinomycetota bacterium]|nr:neutral zinc metallopeptidase [Actinomycetota bacterium]